MILSQIIRQTIVYGGADFISKIITFFSFPIIAAIISTEDFGLLELIGTLTTFLGLFVNCGLNNSVQRFYWDNTYPTDSKTIIVSTAFFSQVLFGVIIFIVGIFIIPLLLNTIDSTKINFTWLSLIGVIILVGLTQWSQFILDVLRLYFLPYHFFFLALTTRVATIALGIIALVIFKLGIEGYLIAQVVAFFAVLPVGLWLIRRDIKFSKFNFFWFKKLVGFGYPFIFAGFGYWLFSSIDRWMLASFSSIKEVGIYSVSSRFSSIVLFVSAAFGQAWSPLAMKIRSDYPNNYTFIYGQALLFLIFIMLIIGGGVALFSGELISVFMPSKYIKSILPLTILSIAAIFHATQQITAIGITLANRTAIFIKLTWFTALVNFVGNLILIPSYGALGASWATLISYFLLTSSYMYYTQRLYPINVNWIKILILIIFCILITIISIIFVMDKFIFWVFGLKLIFGVLCIIWGWKLIGISSENKIINLKL